MLNSRGMSLKPVLECADGVHLTAYLIDRGEISDLKCQLQDARLQAYEWLASTMSDEEIAEFLDPIDSLLIDSRVLKKMSGNIGIFRIKDFFAVLSIPIQVEQTCQVTTSFHVKPILHWMQTDQEFLLLEIEDQRGSQTRNQTGSKTAGQTAYLYLCSHDSLALVDSIQLSDQVTSSKNFSRLFGQRRPKQKKAVEQESLTVLNDWLSTKVSGSGFKLFVAGKFSMIRGLQHGNDQRIPVADSFSRDDLEGILLRLRKKLKAEGLVVAARALQGFRSAFERNTAEKNIFQISYAAAGNIRQPLVSAEQNIFGRRDKASGALVIHPFDLDYDDDLLDDLAQIVLSQGGQVTVASREEVPRGRAILAVLHNDGQKVEDTKDFYRFRGFYKRAI